MCQYTLELVGYFDFANIFLKGISNENGEPAAKKGGAGKKGIPT